MSRPTRPCWWRSGHDQPRDQESGALKHHLKQLKLPTMHGQCEPVPALFAGERRPPGFLLQLCELELIDREQRAAERRLKAAKFLPRRRWTSSTSRPVPASTSRWSWNWSVAIISTSGRTSCWWGTPGPARRTWRRPWGSPLWSRKENPLLASDGTDHYDAGGEGRASALTAAQLLGQARPDNPGRTGLRAGQQAGAELLFDVIATAYERQSLIVTSNLPFENWTEVLGSERLTGAALDRLTHRCHILETAARAIGCKMPRDAADLPQRRLNLYQPCRSDAGRARPQEPVDLALHNFGRPALHNSSPSTRSERIHFDVLSHGFNEAHFFCHHNRVFGHQNQLMIGRPFRLCSYEPASHGTA